jgi:hypothetical protein
MDSTPELLAGTCRQFLFSPDGDIEGLLLTLQGRTVQIVLPPGIGAEVTRLTTPGKRFRLLVHPQGGAADAVHPLYAFDSFVDSSGKPTKSPGAEEIKAMIAGIHLGITGAPNGVITVSGEIILVGEAGMETTGLKLNGKVRAVGHSRVTLLGQRLMIARQINGIDL